MNKIIEDFFKKEKIEYYGVLPVEECHFIRKYLLEREESAHAFRAKSVICYAVPYYTEGDGNISRYAFSRDYHAYVSSLSQKLCECLSARFVGSHNVGFCDHSPIDEVKSAARCGLGVVGKNRLLITEKYSSFVFVGEVFTDINAKTLGYISAERERACLSCGKCKVVCPSGALGEGGGECLSALTQKKGALSAHDVAAIEKSGCAWGCDACQDVCPHTKKAICEGTVVTPIDYFHENKITYLDCDVLDKMDEKEFSARAYAWRKRDTIKRNLEILKKAENEKQKQLFTRENQEKV